MPEPARWGSSEYKHHEEAYRDRLGFNLVVTLLYLSVLAFWGFAVYKLFSGNFRAVFLSIGGSVLCLVLWYLLHNWALTHRPVASPSPRIANAPSGELADPVEQFNIGVKYFTGEGELQDYAEAAKWFRKAAEQGDIYAKTYLGGMYAQGLGVPKDDSKAAKWFHTAAEEGDPDAQLLLGGMYANRRGVPQDYVLAYMWFSLSAAGANENAAKARDAVAQDMTREQIAEAQGLAREWWEKHKKP